MPDFASLKRAMNFLENNGAADMENFTGTIVVDNFKRRFVNGTCVDETTLDNEKEDI